MKENDKDIEIEWERQRGSNEKRMIKERKGDTQSSVLY